MKRLLLIWIFSGSLDSFSQDTAKHHALPPCKHNLPNCKCLRISEPIADTLPTYCNTAGVTLITYRTDTTRSVLLVTGKPPAFTHAVNGYCVRKNGACVGHLDSRGRLFKLPVRVWGCEVNQNRKR
jgi:hypothetical protein